MSTVIKAENIFKKYLIGHNKRESYSDLRETLTNKVKQLARTIVTPFPPARHTTEPTYEEFWALKDVSFDVKQGDRIGIIGRNGAGKSTLLKILSRITEPTTGRISIKGRVASLLEVGTGFHPDLTGRENIFLNGAILGMSRVEIRKKFDEIVDFAEVDRFLDTPVKYYSSGMYVRLAFAVAAHLEPEILIVDEVLAVGDAQFQKKCLGKMGDISSAGRTVLFVSHQMGAIAQLCGKTLLLKHGSITHFGETQDVIRQYTNDALSSSRPGIYESSPSSTKDIAIIKAETLDSQNKPASHFNHNQAIPISITCKINKWTKGTEVRLVVRDSKRKIFTTETEINSQNGTIPNEILVTAVIPAGVLMPGNYFFTICTYLPNQFIMDSAEDALSITIIDGGSRYSATEGVDYGCVFVDCKWSIESSLALN